MTQNIVNGLVFGGNVGIADGRNLDAFNRLRVSDPVTLWAVQSQYNTNRLMMEVGSTGTGTSAPTHSADTRLVALATTAGTGTVFFQSYEYVPYEPGKSQLGKYTGVIGAGVAGAVVEFGSFDASNGVFLRQNGATNLQLVLRSKTSGSVVDEVINQADWNIDGLNIALNGKNPSGQTLDITKDIILVMDLQFLGMGRVRFYFDLEGILYEIHHFEAANTKTVPYMQTASLPVQMLITTTATAGAKTSYFKCASVESEGGISQTDGFPFSTPEAVETAASGARTHLISIRPKTTLNSITNRERFSLNGISMIVTGANSVYWELVIGATIAASTWADVNTTYSGFEYTSVRGAFTNLTSGLVIASGHVAGAGTGGTSPSVTPIIIPPIVSSKYPITLDRAGAVRTLGTLSLLVSGISGTSATRTSIGFTEVR